MNNRSQSLGDSLSNGTHQQQVHIVKRTALCKQRIGTIQQCFKLSYLWRKIHRGKTTISASFNLALIAAPISCIQQRAVLLASQTSRRSADPFLSKKFFYDIFSSCPRAWTRFVPRLELLPSDIGADDGQLLFIVFPFSFPTVR